MPSSCSAAHCSSRAGSTSRSSALAAAEAAFEQLSSGSHRAAAWTAQADLSVRRGDKDTALSLYRRAAETLQDFRF